VTTSPPARGDGIVNESASFDNTRTWITLSGGTARAKVTITNTVHLASGMTDARSFQLVIQAQ
jgi:hypothetical protein